MGGHRKASREALLHAAGRDNNTATLATGRPLACPLLADMLLRCKPVLAGGRCAS